MSYPNPLHTSVYPSQQSPYSSLGVGTSLNPLASHRQIVPQTPFILTRPSNRKLDHSRLHPPSGPISFDYIGFRKQGIPFREMSTKGAPALQQIMQGGSDIVLVNVQTNNLKITLHIRWPGYEHIEWTRRIDVSTPHGPMTRAQLALTVIHHFGRFLEKIQFEATADIKWRVGPGSIRFEHVALISLYNVFEDCWQAEVAVDFR